MPRHAGRAARRGRHRSSASTPPLPDPRPPAAAPHPRRTPPRAGETHPPRPHRRPAAAPPRPAGARFSRAPRAPLGRRPASLHPARPSAPASAARSSC
ncbi:conserved hypothetical protein, partial [Ricinus communis]